MRVIRAIGKSAIILSAVTMALNAPEALSAAGKGRGKGRVTEERAIRDGLDVKTEQGRAKISEDARVQRTTLENLKDYQRFASVAKALGIEADAMVKARDTFAVSEAKDSEGKDALALVVKSAVRDTEGNVANYKDAVAEFVNLSAAKSSAGSTAVSVAKAIIALKNSPEGVELMQSVVSIAKNSKSGSLDAALKEGLKEKGIDVEKFEEFCKI